MRNLHLLIASVLISSATACGGGGPRDANDVIAARANVTCAKLFECKSTYPGGEADFEATFGATEADCRLLYLGDSDVTDIQASIEDGRIVVDDNAVNSCIAFINGLTCEQAWSQTQAPDSCSQESEFVPQVDTGGECVIDEDCISSFCDTTSMTCSAG